MEAINLSSTTRSSTIRRRPNTNSPDVSSQDGPSTAPQSYSPSLTVPAGDVNIEDSTPTVMLVQQRRYGLGIASVDGMPERSVSTVRPFASRLFQSDSQQDLPARDTSRVGISPPLTSSRPSSWATGFSPPPNMSGPNAWTALLPTAAQLLSPRVSRGSLLPVYATHRNPTPASSPLVSLASANFTATRSIAPAPSSIRSSSSYIHVLRQPSSNPSVCSPIVASFSTADRLTRKFPVHRRSMRNISIAAVSRSMQGRSGAAFAGTLLGEGEGLGIEWPDRWTKHKWCLMLSVCMMFAYGLSGLVFAVLTWYQTWIYADVMSVADFDILILTTVCSAVLLFTFLVGITGTILNSRPILAIYALLLWPAFASILAIGYTAYKRSTFALDRKLNLAWSQWYTSLDRLIIQNAFHCCGFYNPMHEVTASKTCYIRTSLPGCKAKLWAFERANLRRIWVMAFSIVPLHVLNIFVAMCCVNHVTVRFGKGIMPKRYRLKAEDVRRDAARILGGVGTVARPGIVRASSSSMFREDKEEISLLLD